MTATLEMGHVGVGWATARLGNVVFVLHQSSAPDVSVERTMDLIERAVAKHPLGIVLSAIFAPGAPVPSASARQKVSAHLARNASRIVLGVTVIEGTSIRSMAVRTATAMMVMLVREPGPHKVFNEAASACAFIETKAVDDARVPISRIDLLSGIQSLRDAARGAARDPAEG